MSLASSGSEALIVHVPVCPVRSVEGPLMLLITGGLFAFAGRDEAGVAAHCHEVVQPCSLMAPIHAEAQALLGGAMEVHGCAGADGRGAGNSDPAGCEVETGGRVCMHSARRCERVRGPTTP